MEPANIILTAVALLFLVASPFVIHARGGNAARWVRLAFNVIGSACLFGALL